MGLITGILKGLLGDNDYDREKLEKEMDRYGLSKEEKEEVRKGNYQPDEFDYDDDEDHDYKIESWRDIKDDLFNFLVATDQVDEFLGYKLPQEIKEELNKLAEDYNNDLITDDEVQDVLMGIELKNRINYEVLYKYFKEQL